MIDHPQELEALLQAVLGSRCRLVECRLVNCQPDYRVFSARLNHPDLAVIVKLAGPAAQMASQFEHTVAIQKLVADSTTIPMPETLAVDASLQTWPWLYLIYTRLPGIEWYTLRPQLDEAALTSCYQQIGEAVGQLHSIRFPAFGAIDGNCQVAQPEPNCLPALSRHAARIIRSPRLQEAFQAALQNRSQWFEYLVDSRLCHEDLHGYNILFDQPSGEWRLVTILDFDKAWAGPAESDLARMEFWRGMTSPPFWTAYQALQPVPSGYAQRKPLYQLLWCLEFARPTRQHLADTRRVCRELDIPIIKDFDG
jgi:Ser/Thr protein kinase RdoA (MazF antagonist)